MAADVAEGQEVKTKPPAVRITAGEVEITGPTAVTSPSNIKDIGQGHIQVGTHDTVNTKFLPSQRLYDNLVSCLSVFSQVRDKNMKTALLIGTTTVAGGGDCQRIQPVEGTGIALTDAATDKGGLHPRLFL